MNNFTFEAKGSTFGLETYEWDNVWWEQAPDAAKPRVFYIGDSISCGIRRLATKNTSENVLFDGFGTSKAVDNPYFTDSIHLFGKQQKRRKLVLFNNGLHGFHLRDDSEYKDYYKKIVEFLLAEFKDTSLALVLTTSIAGPLNERVIARNKAVCQIAGGYRIPIIDLYAPSAAFAGYRKSDGVHYTEEGYDKLAGSLVNSIYQIFPDLIP